MPVPVPAYTSQPSPSAQLCPISTGNRIAFRSDAVAKDGLVLLSDVADIRILPVSIRARAASLAIPAPRGTANIRANALAGRFRAQMPVLACWLPALNQAKVVIRPDERKATTAPTSGVTAPVVKSKAVRAGDMVSLNVAIGPIRVERQVTAMQAADPGQRMFVKEADGSMLSVRYAGLPR